MVCAARVPASLGSLVYAQTTPASDYRLRVCYTDAFGAKKYFNMSVVNLRKNENSDKNPKIMILPYSPVLFDTNFYLDTYGGIN
jgi:hypothetical protein